MCDKTNKRLERNRPDPTLVHKGSHKWILIVAAVPLDKMTAKGGAGENTVILRFHREISEKYTCLFFIDTLRAIYRDFSDSQDNLGISDITGSAQVAALF